ncbi:UvrB/UvrC motif-containing protein [Sphingomonas montana]|uniref:UvrB/UvrC motif-containing protein n=1 Tax=Sphingomonas montana TaxID=1843236 RepID=UPI00096E8121|nr:UvrB/UvrC motif-containing protein [Sphingomonas montana]
MSDSIADLRRRMAEAAAALDYEEAQRLRDLLATFETDGLHEQQPGAMGLGTSQQRMQPPPGWVRPAKPDPMTRNRNRNRGRTARDD